MTATGTVTAATEEKAQALADALDHRNPPARRASAFAQAARTSIRLKEFYGASKQAETGLELANTAQDIALIADLRFLLGQVSIWIGDMAKAQDNLLAFVAMAKDTIPQSDQRMGMARYNLGLVAGQYRRYGDAWNHFAAAIPLLLNAGLPVKATQAYLDGARCDMFTGGLISAGWRIAEARRLLAAYPDAGLETHLLCYQAQLQHLSGDLAGSDKSCQAVFWADRHGATDQHRAEAAWIMGENALAGGSLRYAQLFAELAIKYATQFMYPWLLNQAIDLRNRVTRLSAQVG